MPFAGLIGMNEIWVLPSLQQGSPFLSVPIIPSNEKFALLHVKHKGGSRGVPQLLTTTAKYWLFMPFIPWGITCYHIVWALSTLLFRPSKHYWSGLAVNLTGLRFYVLTPGDKWWMWMLSSLAYLKRKNKSVYWGLKLFTEKNRSHFSNIFFNLIWSTCVYKHNHKE